MEPKRLISGIGRYCSKFTVQDGYVEDECSKDSVGARQIFPLLKHPNWRTPTIKHHCSRTEMAACRRACSNNVGPSENVKADFTRYFREKFIPRCLKMVGKATDIVIDIQAWFKEAGYSGSYVQKILAALDTDKWGEAYYYEAFAKIEQQFTEVEHEDKETAENTVKERQICGPDDVKKLFANPFMHKMEGVFHRFMDEYCGRKNWIDICDKLDSWKYDFSDPVYACADGSGFDMTQLAWTQQLLNELFYTLASSPTVSFNEPLGRTELMRVLRESIKLRVTTDGIKYITEGRASGDGWTTLGNTLLMICYWKYTLETAGVKHRLMVKGDDVLFCVERNDMDKVEQAWRSLFSTDKELKDFGLGQICTSVKWGDITEMDFLSNHFFRTSNDRLRMTRIPARVIQTISWSTKVTEVDGLKARQELAYSKGMCLLAWAKGLPIFETLGRKLVELGKPGKRSEFDKYADGARVWHDRDDREAYMVYLEENYGLTEGEVIQAEKAIQSLKNLHGEINIPCLARFYHRLV